MLTKIKQFLARFLPLPARSARRMNENLLQNFLLLQENIRLLNERITDTEARINERLTELYKHTTETEMKINERLTELDKHTMEIDIKVNESLVKIDRYITETEIKINEHFATLDKHIGDIEAGLKGHLAEIDTHILNIEPRINERLNKTDKNVADTETRIRRDVYRMEQAANIAVRFKNYDYYKNLKPAEYRRALEEWYETRTGSKLNLDNPQTLNEKIQWLKLYDSTPLKSKLTDKFAVREWISEKIGEQYLIPLLGAWNSFDEVDFGSLPDKFVLKCSHGCAMNLIVRDKKQLNLIDAKNSFDKWQNINFAFWEGLELHYKDIPPRIIAEEYIENLDGDVFDYKIFCFNGKAEYVMFLADRAKGLKMAFFDMDWNLQPFVYSYPRYTEKVEKPECLEKLVEISEKLGDGFAFVRIDFYILNTGEIKFGEMTFTSASGLHKWNLPEYDLILGQKLRLPIDIG